MNKHIKKLSIMTGIFFTGITLVGCHDTKDNSDLEDDSYVLEEVVDDEIEEEEGKYGFEEVSQLAFRRGEEYVGFLVHSYDHFSYPTSASIRYMPISSFSVLTTDDAFYIVKDYQENKKYDTYYDYLRGGAVPKELEVEEISSLSSYIEHHQDLFSNAVSDKYSHFTVFDSKKILQEADTTISDLAVYEQRKYLGVSRISSTEENVCYINYVPVDQVEVVHNSYQCYLVDDYEEGMSSSIYQADLLRGSKVPSLPDYEILPFSDFVLQHPDNFSPSIIEFLNNSEAFYFTISSQDFIDSYQSSIAVQKVK